MTINLVKKSIDNNMNNSNTYGMKTSISIPDDIFEEVNKIAEEFNFSRSQIFCEAVKEYLKKLKARKLLNALNESYADEDTSDEKLLRKMSIEYYTKSVLGNNRDDKTG